MSLDHQLVDYQYSAKRKWFSSVSSKPGQSNQTNQQWKCRFYFGGSIFALVVFNSTILESSKVETNSRKPSPRHCKHKHKHHGLCVLCCVHSDRSLEEYRQGKRANVAHKTKTESLAIRSDKPFTHSRFRLELHYLLHQLRVLSKGQL